MSDKELRDVERFARQKGKEAAQPLPPKNRTMIERYTSDDVLDFNPTGEFVYYSDHEAALAEKDVEIERLEEQVNEKEFDMHSRIRAEYDKAVAEAWKAALAAEKEKVRELVEALEWYVMEDDVIEGMEGNEFWVEGKRKAQALIEKCKEEPNNE